MLKTTDYGDTWDIIPLATDWGWMGSVSVVNAETVWAGKVGAGVAVTTNGGGDWAYGGSPVYQYSLEATDGLHAWAGGSFGPGGAFIQETYNAGEDWTHRWGYGNGSCQDIESSSSTNFWAVGNTSYHGWIAHYHEDAWSPTRPQATPLLPN